MSNAVSVRWVRFVRMLVAWAWVVSVEVVDDATGTARNVHLVLRTERVIEEEDSPRTLSVSLYFPRLIVYVPSLRSSRFRIWVDLWVDSLWVDSLWVDVSSPHSLHPS